MALLGSGQLHQEPIPGYVMWRTAVVATGERGEHDKGTKPADTRPHHHAGADRFTSGNSTGGYPRPFGVRPDTEVVKHLVGSQRGSQNMQSARHAAERPWTARASHTPRRPGDKPQRTSDRGLRISRPDGDEAGLSAFSRPGTTQRVRSKVIMSCEAQARPHKLQKVGQVVHRIDNSRTGKLSTTRLNGRICAR